MFPYNIVLVNPREEEFRSWYVKLKGTSVPIYTIDFTKTKSEIHFIQMGISLELQLEFMKFLADKHPGAPILLLETTYSVENMAKPKLVVKEWKNGEITVKEKGSKSTKAEDFAFINELPEDMINQFMNTPIEPAAQTATQGFTTAPPPPQTTTNPTAQINTNWMFHTDTDTHP